MKEIEYFGGINVGIVGYGKLGQALENRIYSQENLNLVAIFSKREGLVSPYGSMFVKKENLEEYAGRIDYLFLCGGSFDEMTALSVSCAKLFNTIDCYDTHSNMWDYLSNLNDVNKENKTTSLIACGWDPGLFSMMRCLMFSLGQDAPFTFWGKGLSQGHSNALRQVKGVKDAISYTIPINTALKSCYNSENVPEKERHERVCYVVKEKTASKKALSKIIPLIPNYFEGYKVKVHFVSQYRLNKMKQSMPHRGEVFKSLYPQDKKCFMKFSLDLDSNPHFTAECMLMGLKALNNLSKAKKYGAFTLFDIPLKYFTSLSKKELVTKFL